MDSSSDKLDEDLFDEIIEFDGDDSDDDKENRKHERGRKAKKLQMNKLKSFMAEHNDLRGKSDLWGKLTNELNALGPPIFTDSEWKLKWSQHKYNNKRKLSTETAGSSIEIAGTSTETARPPTKMAKATPNDCHTPTEEPVIEQIVTLSDILQEMKKSNEKQDAILEALTAGNKMLETIAKSLKK